MSNLTFKSRFLVLLGVITMCVTQVWGAALGTGYTKITDITSLSAGDVVVLYCDDSSSGVTGYSGSDATVSTTATDWIQFAVEKSGSNYYLKNPSDNMYVTKQTSNKLTISATSASENECTVNNNGVLCINSRYLAKNGNYYRMYKSVGSYQGVFVYKVTNSGPTDATWSVEPASVNVMAGKKTTATITTNYDGNLSVVSNAEGTATASIEGKTITVSGVAEGSTTLLVTGAATSNYNAISKTIDVIVTANNRPAGEVFYESFDTNDGTGGNDSKWSGNIASNNIKEDNDGWVFENGYGANECAKFGTGSKLGTAQTPAVSGTGNFTLTFKAAAWNGGSESTTLKLSATNATLSEYSVTLTKGAWDTYNVNITDATTGFTINFEGNAASNSRFFLDEVSIVSAGPAGSCATPTFSQEGGSYCGTQSVTISCTTDGASIYYTTDGTTPTSSSTLYSSAISVSADMTIKAIAVKDGLIDSEVATATYSITDLRDTFIDNLHENATQYGDCDNYTVPSLSDATPASACEGEHYHFVGWSSAQLYTGQHATEPAGLLKAGSHHSADGTTYYAVWAKEQH